MIRSEGKAGWGRLALVGSVAGAVLVAACSPSAPASPTAAPKATEAAKPAGGAAPAASPAAAKPAASPAAGAAGAPAASAPAPVLPTTAADLRSLTGTVRVDGSSTVFPVSEAMAEEFQKATGGKVRVTVGISGTGGGFKKFCSGETDVQNASRPIQKGEIEACEAQGIKFIELPIAFDGLSIMTSPRNTFLNSITVSELKKMWEPAAQGTITRWNQVNPAWPDRAIKLYGAGADSGTFDYFTDAINGKEKASRGDYTASEDDNVLVQGISNDPDAIGYFGYAYYDNNKDKLKLVAVDAEKGAGPILPSPETIANGSYAPLSRPIFIYAKVSSLEKLEVVEFLRFYLTAKNSELVKQVGYIPFPERYYGLAMDRFLAKQAGTVFPGGSQLGVKLDDLFAKTPTLP